MANVDTLPEILRPLMEGPSIETPRCAVCGAPWPLNRHHIVRRGAGKLFRDGREVPKPTVMLCGSGNGSGCHGLAHANRLHFRWVRAEQRFNRPAPPGSGHWEYLLLPEPTKYADALAMDGWGRLPRGRRCMWAGTSLQAGGTSRPGASSPTLGHRGTGPTRGRAARAGSAASAAACRALAARPCAPATP